MLGRLRRALEGDFGRLIATGVAQNLPAQSQGVGVGLEGKRAVERQQSPVALAELVRGIAELVPDEREVGIRLYGALELGQGFPVASELCQRRTAERKGETGF